MSSERLPWGTSLPRRAHDALLRPTVMDAQKPLVAYGDPDDHLRLAVLLAMRLGVGEGHACCDPSSSWRTRLDALEDLLRERERSAPLAIVDPDALDVGVELEGRDAWDDATFRGQRSQLLDLLVRDFGRGGWQVRRPEPSPRLTRLLTRLPQDDDGSAEEADWNTVGISAGLVPIGRGLVSRGAMDPIGLRETLELSSTPERLLLGLGYEALAADSREAAWKLAVPRGPQPRNGVAGPFRVAVDDIPSHTLHELTDKGWVLGPAKGSYSMSRSVRGFLLERFEAVDPAAFRAAHGVAAQGAPVDAAGTLERHHHAIEAGDGDLALTSATFYGSDLRALARRRSMLDQDYAGAAELYRAIVERFDREDAYAHEYLAYNLEQHLGPRAFVAPHRDEILEAYTSACDHDRTNPLYRGRLLAFRARAGDRVAAEAIRYVRRFAGSQFPRSAVSYFAERVLRALRERNAWDQIGELDQAHGPLLRRDANLRALLAR